jgi:hypothetical protein
MMRRLILALTLTAALAAPAAAAPDVERLLSGTPDGKPQSCIRQRDLRGQTIVDRSTIVFERGGGRYYRNDVGPGCAALRPDRALITHEAAIGICENEIFEVFDPLSRINYGACTFGPFVPYRRAPAK